jgi:Ras-related protein Rab-2A
MSKLPIVKIFVSGEGGVGKTTMIERYIKGTFNAHTILTIGVQHSLYSITSSTGKKFAYQIWDLGGEERFKVIVPIYVRGSCGGIIVFDESRFITFKNLDDWITLIKKDLDPSVPVILVSTKSDLVDRPQISEESINELLTRYKLKAYFRTSAKTGNNINEIFQTLADLIEKAGKI